MVGIIKSFLRCRDLFYFETFDHSVNTLPASSTMHFTKFNVEKQQNEPLPTKNQ